jgi:hypothetical protein
LDHLDIHLEVPGVDYEKISEDRMGDMSESLRARVQATPNIQLTRFTNIDTSTMVSLTGVMNYHPKSML